MYFSRAVHFFIHDVDDFEAQLRWNTIAMIPNIPQYPGLYLSFP